VRHQRLHGALQPVHAAVRACAPAERRTGRGLRLRHPPHPDHAAAPDPKPRRRTPPGGGEGGRLERWHSHR
jgi:hypothetical protein